MNDQNTPKFSVTLRESRMVIDRLLQFKGLPAGRRPALTDAGLYSASMGLSGFPLLLDTLEKLSLNIESPSLLQSDGDDTVLDARQKHAWLVAPEAADILVNRFKRRQGRRLLVRNVAAAEELRVVSAIIEKYGFGAEISVATEGEATLRLTDIADAAKPELLRICLERIPVDRNLWFHLFHTSNQALAPDTKVSRMHTGTVVMNENGEIVGSGDDEFLDMDLSLLEAEILEEPGMEEGKRQECL